MLVNTSHAHYKEVTPQNDVLAPEGGIETYPERKYGLYSIPHKELLAVVLRHQPMDLTGIQVLCLVD